LRVNICNQSKSCTTYSEELAHLGGGGLELAQTIESEVVFRAVGTVAEVAGLDNIDDLSVLSELGHGDNLGARLDGVLGEFGDVVLDLAPAGDGVLHDIVHSARVVFGREIVFVLPDHVLTLGVNLELADQTLDKVDFGGGELGADDEAADDAVLHDDLEGLLGEFQGLPGESGFVDLGAPASGEGLVNLGLLSVDDAGVEGLGILGLDAELGLEEDAVVLVGDVVEGGEGAAGDLVVVLLAYLPGAVLSAGGGDHYKRGKIFFLG